MKKINIARINILLPFDIDTKDKVKKYLKDKDINMVLDCSIMKNMEWESKKKFRAG